MKKLISVIVPCYEQGRFLLPAIESIQRQTYDNWEAIIVNDGSSDDTAIIAKRLCSSDGRIKYVTKQNGGLSSARNVGLKLACGDYIQFLDADDILGPEKFATQIICAHRQSSRAIIYGNAWYFRGDSMDRCDRGPYGKSPEHDWIDERWNDSRPSLVKLINFNLFPVCAALVPREVVSRVGAFDENLSALEDWQYWLRCSIAGERFFFCSHPDSVVYIRTHRESMTNDLMRMRVANLKLRIGILQYNPPNRYRWLILKRIRDSKTELSRDFLEQANGIFSHAQLNIIDRWFVQHGGAFDRIIVKIRNLRNFLFC